MESGSDLDAFRRVCGLDGRLVLEVDGPGREGGEIHEFDQPFAVLGRDARADMVLPHPQVNRRHVYLQVLGGRVLAVDLESRSGTWREGWPLASDWLAPGDVLTIGPWRVRLPTRGRAEPESTTPDDPLAPQPASQAALPPLGLVESIGPDGVRTWVVRPALALVGRARTCRVRIDDCRLARHHCALIRTVAGPWVVNLRGHDDLAVNDRLVRAALLQDGDDLRVGNGLHLTIRRRGSGTAPPSVAWTRKGVPALREVARAAVPSRILPTSPSLPAVPALSAPPLLPASRFVPGMLAQEVSQEELDRIAPLLAVLSSHFEQTQQQMFGMFQQSLQAVGQTFSNLHDQHAVQVREELEQLRQINREIIDLQTRMLDQSTTAPSPPPTNGNHAPSPPPTNGNHAPSPPPTNGNHAPSPPPVPYPPQPEAAGSATGFQVPPTPPSATGTGNHAAFWQSPKPHPTATSPEGSSTELHARIALRMATLQREQQGGWQRLVDLVAKRS